jgi:hypothetical protein
MSLRACSTCQRHVREHETRCPFCDSELAPAIARSVPDVSRMSRAARLAVGAALAAATLPGCTKTSSEAPDSNIAQPYGAPPQPTETAIAQPYGAPPEPPPEASDAGANDATLSVPVPAYGAPPPAPSDK